MVSAGQFHHAICESCEGILHLEESLLKELEDHLEELHRFRTLRTEVLVIGVCDACARQAQRHRPPARMGRRTLEHVHYRSH